MRTNLLMLFVVFSFCAKSQNFGTGSFVVFRTGDGLVPLANTGNKIFLDEYSSTGVYVRSIEMPSTNTAPANNVVINGTNNVEGNITRSPNGLYLVVAGYNPTSIPYASSILSATSAAVPRVVAWVTNNSTINTLSLNDWCSGNAPRSATTNDATQFWLGGGTGGVNYRAVSGSATVNLYSTIPSIRNVLIADGNLYASSTTSNPRLGQIGTGLPTTTGQTFTGLNGYPANTTAPNQFVFLDLNPSITGVDVLFVAEEGGGIKKYSFDGTTWTLNGSIGIASEVYRGVIASANGSTVTLFATKNAGNAAGGGGALVTVTDNSGYNGAPSTTLPTLLDTLLNTSQKAFRGIAWAPTASPLPAELQSFNARVENDYLKIWWTTSTEVNVNKFIVEKSLNGIEFSAINSLSATNKTQGAAYTCNDENVISNVTYYRLKIVDNDGSFKYSKVIRIVTNVKGSKMKVLSNPVINGNLNLIHTKASNASTINIYSADSKLMKSVKVVAGNTQTILDVTSLISGHYIVEMMDVTNGINQSTKFIKK